MQSRMVDRRGIRRETISLVGVRIRKAVISAMANCQNCSRARSRGRRHVNEERGLLNACLCLSLIASRPRKDHPARVTTTSRVTASVPPSISSRVKLVSRTMKRRRSDDSTAIRLTKPSTSKAEDAAYRRKLYAVSVRDTLRKKSEASFMHTTVAKSLDLILFCHCLGRCY